LALEALTARANTGTGTDQLAVVDTASGKAGAVALVDDAGELVTTANPLPVEIQGSIPVSGSVTVSNFPATQPVSLAASPLPTGAATEASLAALYAKTPGSLVDMPTQDSPSVPVRVSPQKYTDVSFSAVGSGLLSSEITQIRAGSGMTVSQSAGNLVVASGTTVNAEFVARSVTAFNGALTLKNVVTLSQRIVNNNFFIELVDVIGDGLAYTIVNATTVDVTLAGHGYTAQNVGQRIDLCALSSVGVPMEGVIASIPDANTIRFTVAGWPGSGSGTLSLTGWNKVELLFTGTTATAVSFNTRRRGWQNTAIAATILTTASGVMTSVALEGGVASLADKLATSAGVLANRASWDTNIPLPTAELFIQIRARNGTVAPASTTTWTIGMVRVEDYIAQQVSIVSTRQQTTQNALPVSGAVTVSGTATVSGTVTATVTAGTVNPVVPATPYILNSAASTNEVLILTGTSGLQAFYATNTGAGVAFVKLYNKATAPASTDVPAMILVVPAAVSGVPGVCTLPIGFSGFRFALGLGIRVTGGVADNDTTAVAAGQVKVMLSRTV
jgi:hypothetical protein